MAAGGRSLGAIGAVHYKQKDPPSAWYLESRFSTLADSQRKLLPQKRTPSTLRTWGLEVCCLKIRLLQLGGGCRGMGCRPARPDERHLATRPTYSMRHAGTSRSRPTINTTSTGARLPGACCQNVFHVHPPLSSSMSNVSSAFDLSHGDRRPWRVSRDACCWSVAKSRFERASARFVLRQVVDSQINQEIPSEIGQLGLSGPEAWASSIMRRLRRRVREAGLTERDKLKKLYEQLSANECLETVPGQRHSFHIHDTASSGEQKNIGREGEFDKLTLYQQLSNDEQIGQAYSFDTREAASWNR
jgi:hypothetical protein